MLFFMSEELLLIILSDPLPEAVDSNRASRLRKSSVYIPLFVNYRYVVEWFESWDLEAMIPIS